MENIPFFTLTADETHPLAILCISLTEGMVKQGKISKPEDLLHGEFLEAFQRLKEKLLSMKLDKDENGDYVGKEITLDVHESFAMTYSIVMPFYRLKAHVSTPPEKRTDVNPEQAAEADAVFYDFKDDAANLLERLTIAWNYFDYGLQTLEQVFDRKIAVRPLKVDDEKEVATITINEHNTHLFNFMFQWLDIMKLFQDKYDFARQLYSCQFIHITDYDALKEKLPPKNKRKKISLTLRNDITLYCTISLLGIFFLSDASGLYEEIGAKADAARPDSPPSKNVQDYFLREGDKAAKAYEEIGLKVDASGIIHTSFRDIRDFFLKFSDQYLAEMRKAMKKLPLENKIFTEHIECVKQWKV